MQAAGGRDLGRLMAVVSLPTALGPILGPVVGGLILSGASWPWLFWVNVPFAVAGLVLAWFLSRPTGRPCAPGSTSWALLLLSPAVVALLYGLSGVGEAGGFARLGRVGSRSPSGSSCCSAFTAWALRRRGAALVDVHLLRHRPLAASASLLFLTGASLYGAMLLLPLSFQELRGLDALGAGLLLIPQGVGALLSRTLAGRAERPLRSAGRRAGGLRGPGAGHRAVRVRGRGDARPGGWSLVLLVRGVGLGAVTIPLMAVGFVGLARDEIPHASIITRISMQVGGAVGVAVLAVVLQRATAVVAAGGGLPALVLVGGRPHGRLRAARARPAGTSAAGGRGRGGGGAGAGGRLTRAGGSVLALRPRGAPPAPGAPRRGRPRGRAPVRPRSG